MKLKDLIGETFYPKAKDEQRFFDKHEPVTFKNIYSGEKYDHMFKGSNLKQATKDEPRHGYTDGADEKVYEAYKAIDRLKEIKGKK
jgi:hypothetical protein